MDDSGSRLPAEMRAQNPCLESLAKVQEHFAQHITQHTYQLTPSLRVTASLCSVFNTPTTTAATAIDPTEFSQYSRYSRRATRGRTDNELRAIDTNDISEDRHALIEHMTQEPTAASSASSPFVLKPHNIKSLKNILHVSVPAYKQTWSETEAVNEIKACYEKALDCATQHHVTHISFPLLGLGDANYPRDIGIQGALLALAGEHARTFQHVYLATGAAVGKNDIRRRSKFDTLCEKLFAFTSGRMVINFHPNLHQPVPNVDSSFKTKLKIVLEASNHPIECQDVPLDNGVCVLLKNFFSKQQARALREFSKALKFEDVGWEYDPGYRTCGRHLLDSSLFATEIFSRLSRTLTRKHIENVRPFGFGNEGIWVPVAVNQRFRFSKYETGGKFSRHRDGSFVEHDDLRSVFSIVCYLNDQSANFTGGETVFYEGEASSTSKEVARFVPEAGNVLVFTHDVLHEGLPIKTVLGEPKFIFRTDVMFRRVDTGKLLDDPLRYKEDPRFQLASRLYTESIDLQAAGNVVESTRKYLEALELQAQLASKKHNETSQIAQLLPEELWLQIMTSLKSPSDLVACSAVCRTWRTLARSNALWKRHFQNRWPNAATGVEASNHVVANTTVYEERPLRSISNSRDDITNVWWRTFQYRLEAESKFQTIVVSMSPDEVKYGCIGFHLQHDPTNRGAWGGDQRIRDDSISHHTIPHRIAKSRGHYWSAASGFNSHFVGDEVGASRWFGELGAVRALNAQGSVDLQALQIILFWIIYFGMEHKLQPQSHPVCLVLPACVAAFEHSRQRIFEMVTSEMGVPFLFIIDASVAIANAHGFQSGVVVEAGEEYVWIVPVVDNCAKYENAVNARVTLTPNTTINDYFGKGSKQNIAQAIIEVAQSTVPSKPRDLLSAIVLSVGNSDFEKQEFVELLSAQLHAKLGSRDKVNVFAPISYDTVKGAEAFCSTPDSRDRFMSREPSASLQGPKLKSLIESSKVASQLGWSANVPDAPQVTSWYNEPPTSIMHMTIPLRKAGVGRSPAFEKPKRADDY